VNNLDPKSENDLKSINKVRDIRKEILDFGISQKEIIKLIELLCLELEDTKIMREVLSVVKPTKKEEKPKLLL
tara:strand:- start:169 stop:387 length:219 start_codon:yes stop_codon:yes gene_type:complete